MAGFTNRGFTRMAQVINQKFEVFRFNELLVLFRNDTEYDLGQ